MNYVKKVINICDGEKLGNVCDIDFDIKQGENLHPSLFQGPCKLFGVLGRDMNILFLIVMYKESVRMSFLVEADIEKCLHKCEWN